MQIDPHTSSLHCGCTAAPSTHLDVGARLVRHLHDELAALAVGLVHQVVQDVQVHGGPQVVDVGHEDVLLALRDQLLQQARVVEAGVDVPVARRVPALRALPSHAQAGGHREEGLLVDARVPGWRRSQSAGHFLRYSVLLQHKPESPLGVQHFYSRRRFTFIIVAPLSFRFNVAIGKKMFKRQLECSSNWNLFDGLCIVPSHLKVYLACSATQQSSISTHGSQ